MQKIILGVDGGNTKTDYFLFTNNGEFIDLFRGPTCSHEQFKNSYTGAYDAMKKVFDVFLPKNKLKAEDVEASVFGLAGVDTPSQRANMEEVVRRLGFKHYKVVNDSFLGVKAVTTSGVCSINGTGTSSGGIDPEGNYLQVGGIGGIVGDEAGGAHIGRCAIRAAYDDAYRFGEPTTLTKIIMDYFLVTDKYYLMEAISDGLVNRKIDFSYLNKQVFKEANNGDEVSLEILRQIGENTARSAGGVINNLNFGDTVDVVLAGSVWVKGKSKVMIDEFKNKITEFTKKECNIITLDVPPATGAVIWALELANNEYPAKDLREKIINNVQNELDRIEG
ncbi:MAG: BadF/BadG/BcrA/BcrD ATPase family protein [Bacilli bacterium]|nr:N-acetylglucosamine kinase [Bacilli bacterium]